jgi:hypothetical protein
MAAAKKKVAAVANQENKRVTIICFSDFALASF